MTPIHRLAVRSLALTTLLLLAAGAARAASLFGGSHTDVVAVGVRELPADDAWQVSWRLPRKAAGVDFVHGRGAYRRAGWTVAPANAQWVDAPADTERICFARASRELAVSFRSDFAMRPKDYEAEVALSDGGRLFYTGQLVVRPLETCGPAAPATAASTDSPAPDRELLHRFQFTTAAGRNVQVLDQAAPAALTWKPASGAEETYAYFGPQSAAIGERVALIVDPSLPEWMRRELKPTVTKLFDRFAGETGMSLPLRPLVVVSFSPSGSGFSSGGGQLGGMLQIAFSGEGLRSESAEGRTFWVKHLAHEVFHLWDGFALHADAESEWLSEAAAEAFALRAAYGLGVLTDRQIAERLVDLGNQCLAQLDGQSLLSAPQRRAWDSWYSCGPVLLFVAGQAVERKQPGKGGLGLLVREMFAEGQRAGGVYGTGLFLGWLDKLSEDRATVFALQGIIRRGVPRGADRALETLFQGAGYRVVLAPPSEAKASPEVFAAMLRKGLTRCACGPAGPPADATGDCARLAGQERIVRVGDVEVRRDPAAAYDRLRAGAGLGTPVRVVAGDDPQPLTLFCGRDTLDPSFDQLLRLQ